ncbi:hypothetical protein [Paenibacillus lautus]|uniref:hypothetical protein n=1 Tax=Paenibacillus lautus TaxID=1401 RepID=UPI003D290642
MFIRESISLNDYQAAMLVQRGNSVQLTVFQEDQVLEESGIYQPAKSFTLNNESVQALKELLTKIDLTGGE